MTSVQIPRKSRVLVVDDNRDHLAMLASLLRSLGQDVQIASNGPAALWLASAFRPDVVFLDIAMPKMDGYEVARELRRLPETKAARIVAITGVPGQTKEQVLEAGCDEFLQKPASVAQITASLE